MSPPFWITGIGRSGTTWLARTLDRSPAVRVRHEEADPYHPLRPEYWEPFPVERFSEDYGECHGKLRRHLSPLRPGLERLIPHRAILLRDRRALCQSWMRNLQPEDFGWVVRAICQEERKLLDYAASDPEARMFRLEELTSDLTVLQDLIDWLEIDLTATAEHQRTRHNAAGWNRFPLADEWPADVERTYRVVSDRFAWKGPRHG